MRRSWLAAASQRPSGRKARPETIAPWRWTWPRSRPALVSQSSTEPSNELDASQGRWGWKATEQTSRWCPSKWWTGRPVRTSHTLTSPPLLLAEPEASIRPSGLKATHQTIAECPRRVRTSVMVRPSQRLTVWSCPAVATQRPSGLAATPQGRSEWPPGTTSVFTSTRTAPSGPAPPAAASARAPLHLGHSIRPDGADLVAEQQRGPIGREAAAVGGACP